ncbi:hypothetical protein JW964_03205 [candidate division KSB1 bacterium]|nr:hypothetical protein [candidate division KSB1 bacterium]
MPITSTLSFLQSNPGWDLIKSLFNYYGLRDYLKFQYYEKLKPPKIREIYAYKNNPNISGEQIFWREIMTGQIAEGDLVKLINFQISPWFPRKPGLYWTYEAAKARKIAKEKHVEGLEENFIIFDVWGKTLMTELGGIGSVNIRKNRDNVLITATASGYTDRGIPIICPQNLWHEINSALRRDQMIEVDLSGTIEDMPLEYDSYFLRSPGLPKIAVFVSSLLNIRIKVSRLNIVVSPWTIFETSNEYGPYGFAYVTHNLSEDDMRNSVNWINTYIEKKGGSIILTDFDEETNSLNARFPLNGGLDGFTYNAEDIIRYCQEIKKRFDRENK